MDALRYTIAHILGVTSGRRVLLVGAGNLGAALMSYEGFGDRGMHITAVADSDPAKIGTTINGYTIVDIHDIGTDHDMELAIVAVPGSVAQEVADILVDAGITGILNFAPRRLQVPDHVKIQTVDLSAELQILAFHREGRPGKHVLRLSARPCVGSIRWMRSTQTSNNAQHNSQRRERAR